MKPFARIIFVLLAVVAGMVATVVGDSPYGEIKLGKYRITKELEKCFLPGYQGERVEVSEYPHRTILPLLLFGIAVIAYREIRGIMRKEKRDERK